MAVGSLISSASVPQGRRCGPEILSVAEQALRLCSRSRLKRVTASAQVPTINPWDWVGGRGAIGRAHPRPRRRTCWPNHTSG